MGEDSTHGDPGAPAWRAELSRTLMAVCVALLGMFVVVRPVAYQLSPYSAETAFAGLLAVLIAFSAWGIGLTKTPRVGAPSGWLGLALVFLPGLMVLGFLRSPNQGAALPRLGEAGMYVLLLLSTYFLVQASRGMVALKLPPHGIIKLLLQMNNQRDKQ